MADEINFSCSLLYTFDIWDLNDGMCALANKLVKDSTKDIEVDFHNRNVTTVIFKFITHNI